MIRIIYEEKDTIDFSKMKMTEKDGYKILSAEDPETDLVYSIIEPIKEVLIEGPINKIDQTEMEDKDVLNNN